MRIETRTTLTTLTALGLLLHAAPARANCGGGGTFVMHASGETALASCGASPEAFFWYQGHAIQRTVSANAFENDTAGADYAALDDVGIETLLETEPGSERWWLAWDWGNWAVDGCIFNEYEDDESCCDDVLCMAHAPTYGVTNVVVAGPDEVDPTLARVTAISVDLNERFQGWVLDNAGAPSLDGLACGEDALSFLDEDLACGAIPRPEIADPCSDCDLAVSVGPAIESAFVDDCATANSSAIDCPRNLYDGRQIFFRRGSCVEVPADTRLYDMPGLPLIGTSEAVANWLPWADEDVDLDGVVDVGEDPHGEVVLSGAESEAILRVPRIAGADDCVYLAVALRFDASAPEPYEPVYAPYVSLGKTPIPLDPAEADLCGNGRADPGEACDDGNADDGDDCTGACEVARCGDGFVRVGIEACDDGNAEDSDGCPSTCEVARCGDGFTRAGVEACDDADADDADGCRADCTSATCGDGVVWVGVEACDDGNVDDEDDCLVGCVRARCGDGFVHVGVEGCDDGNVSDGDSCLTSCVDATCGDGIVHEGVEACDDADLDDGNDCTTACEVARCGDALLHDGVESCDDGNDSNDDGCLTDCHAAFCGDGFLWVGVETCDDRNIDDTDDCPTNCRIARCGDGFVRSATEECDDGNHASGDGCSADCLFDDEGTDADSDGDGDVDTDTDADTDGGSDADSEGEGDSSSDAGSASTGGCGCASASSAPPPMFAGAGALLFALTRRRRRLPSSSAPSRS